MKYRFVLLAYVITVAIASCNSEEKTTVNTKDSVILAPGAAPSTGSSSNAGDTASYQQMQQKTTETPQ